MSFSSQNIGGTKDIVSSIVQKLGGPVFPWNSVPACHKCLRSTRPVFLKLFYSIAPFSLSTRGFRSLRMINQTRGSQLKNFI